MYEIPDLKWWQHLYYSVKHGDWDWGWEMYEGKPKFGFFADYYDGYCWAFHLGPFWINALHY